MLLPQIGREPININKDDEYYIALKSREETYIKNNDTHMDSTLFPIGSTVAFQRGDLGLSMHVVLIEANSSDHEGQF